DEDAQQPLQPAFRPRSMRRERQDRATKNHEKIKQFIFAPSAPASPSPLFIRFGCNGSSPSCLRCQFVSIYSLRRLLRRLLRSSSASAATAHRRLAFAASSSQFIRSVG